MDQLNDNTKDAKEQIEDGTPVKDVQIGVEEGSKEAGPDADENIVKIKVVIQNSSTLQVDITCNFTQAAADIRKGFENIDEEMGKFGHDVEEAIIKFRDNLKEDFCKAGTDLKKFFDYIDGEIKKFGHDVEDKFVHIEEDFIKFGNNLKEEISKAGTDIKENFDYINIEVGKFGQVLKDMFVHVKEDIRKFGDNLKDEISRAGTVIKEHFDYIDREMKKFGQHIEYKLIYDMGKFGHDLEDSFVHVIEEIMKFGDDMKKDINKIGTDMKEGFDDVGKEIDQFVQAVEKTFKTEDKK